MVYLSLENWPGSPILTRKSSGPHWKTSLSNCVYILAKPCHHLGQQPLHNLNFKCHISCPPHLVLRVHSLLCQNWSSLCSGRASNPWILVPLCCCPSLHILSLPLTEIAWSVRITPFLFMPSIPLLFLLYHSCVKIRP